LEDVPRTGYVDLLDEKLHFTGKPVKARRQYIIDRLCRELLLPKARAFLLIGIFRYFIRF
jgi:hypothetical protein